MRKRKYVVLKEITSMGEVSKLVDVADAILTSYTIGSSEYYERFVGKFKKRVLYINMENIILNLANNPFQNEEE